MDNYLMNETQIKAQIASKNQIERFDLLGSVTHIQDIVHKLKPEECEFLRVVARIAEIIIRLPPEDQRIVWAMISNKIIESETVTSMVRYFNPYET